MDIIDTILYLVINSFHVYLFFLAYRIFFGVSKYDRRIEMLGFFVFYLVNSAMFLAAENPFLNLATSILPLVALTFLYRGETKTKLLISIFVYGASMLLESLTFSILQFSGIGLAVYVPVVVNMAANMLLFSIELIYKKAKEERIQKALKVEYWLAIIALPIGSIVITALVYSSGYSAISNLAIVTILIMVNILAFRLYELLHQYYFSNYERNLLQQQNEAYVNEFEIIRKTDEASRLMRHDFKNHITAIKQLLKSRKLEELDVYLADFGNFTVKGEYVSSGNPEVDSMLNYKLSTAESIGAEMETEVMIPTQWTIAAFDISVILGNLLDNANEAMDKSPVKRLEVRMHVDRGVLFIHISNTYSGEVKKITHGGDTIYLTQKEQKEMHGIGLSSVVHTVEKYDGIIDIDNTGQQFAVDIMLYLP